MHVDHGELFCHPGRRVVQRQRVAHHADRRIGGAARKRRGDQVGRRHQAVAVGVMLVDADRVVAAVGGVFELIHEVVVHMVRAPRIEQRRVDVHPHRRMLLFEVLRQLGVRHQVEPHQLHGADAPGAVLPGSIDTLSRVAGGRKRGGVQSRSPSFDALPLRGGDGAADSRSAANCYSAASGSFRCSRAPRSNSATRNASSSACVPFSLGSHCV